MPNSTPYSSGYWDYYGTTEEYVNLGPRLIAVNATFSDVDNNFDGGTIVVSGLAPDDIISIGNQLSGGSPVSYGGGNIISDCGFVGTATGGTNGEDFVITLNSIAGSVDIQQILQNLTYENLSDDPTLERFISIKITDDQGAVARTPIVFDVATGGANPFNSVDGGSFSPPTFVDIDGDGDLDMVMGEAAGTLSYFENTGTAVSPNMVARTGALNPFNGIDVGSFSAPVFADIDGDGDMDAVIGENNGNLNYYENTGTALAAVWTSRTGPLNPFDGIAVSAASTPGFGDLDGDGDLDLIVGEFNGIVNVYENTGTQIAPNYVALIGIFNPFNGLDVGTNSTPTLIDIDGDGDLDAVVGEQDGNINYWENVGTALTPQYAVRTSTDNPFDGIDIGTYSTPTFADIDGYGDVDLMVGELDGTVNTYLNAGIIDVYGPRPDFVERTGSDNPFDGISIGSRSVPVFVDLDGDGDDDLVIGEGIGTLNYYKNTGTTLAPVFSQQTGAGNPFVGIDIGDISAPVFVDIDGDGDDDLVIGEGDGTLNYFKNTGTTLAPVFVQQSGIGNPFSGINLGSSSKPTFVDIDGDGDDDLVVGEFEGMLYYYKNTGTTLTPVFTQQTGTGNPFNGIDVGFNSAPVLVDIDGDGDDDLVIGEDNGTLSYYKNTGTTLAPVFTQQTGAGNPFDGIDIGTVYTPTFVDIDGDGDDDLVIGEIFGVLNYYENTGSGFITRLTVLPHTDPSENDDVMNGTSGSDTISGLGGNDTIRGHDGVDYLYGNAGADNLEGGADDDFLFVDADDVLIDGGTGYDRLFAEAGSLALNIDLDVANLEYAQGGNWNDVFDATDVGEAVKLWGHGRDDTLTGSEFADYINGGAGNDTLNGLAGNDILDGSTGADIFNGGAGDDIMYIDADDTTINGGADYDRVFVRGYSAGVNVDLTTGNLEYANGNTQGDQFFATGATWSVRLFGQGGDDYLAGGNLGDQLYGSIGIDRLVGNGGDDLLSGGAGADSLFGGDGNDILFIDADDTLIDAGADYDRVYVTAGSAGVTLSMATAGVEFAYGAAGDDVFNADGMLDNVKIQGLGGADILTGGSGADLIYGGTGADQIAGGRGGDDFLSGGGTDGAIDTFFFNVAWGNDTISDFQNGEDIMNLASLGTNFASLTITALGANNSVVSFGGDSITLLGMQFSDIDTSDFVFV